MSVSAAHFNQKSGKSSAFLRTDFGFEVDGKIIGLVYFSGRLVPAYNRRLYPCHKRLLDEVSRCEKLPKDFVERSNHLLKTITCEAMLEYYEPVAEYFRELDFSDTERVGYILEDEWAWKTGKLPVSER